MQVSEYFIPPTQFYGPIEPAFTSCQTGSKTDDYIIPYALGPPSLAIGGCQARYGSNGECWGTFYSRDVDARDTPWGCINDANNTTSVCRVGASSEPYTSDSKPQTPSSSSSPLQQSPPSLPVLKTLKNYNHQPNMTQARSESAAKKAANAQSTNLFVSYDVYDSPYLSRGLQSTSDPAGWLNGIPTYNNLMQRAESSTLTDPAPWGQCSSYGNYSASPNSSLTSNNRCSGGNCALGQRA